jgi:hypothetical protein
MRAAWKEVANQVTFLSIGSYLAGGTLAVQALNNFAAGHYGGGVAGIAGTALFTFGTYFARRSIKNTLSSPTQG